MIKAHRNVNVQTAAKAFCLWKGCVQETPLPIALKRLVARACLNKMYSPLVSRVPLMRAWWRWAHWSDMHSTLSSLIVRKLQLHLRLVARALQAEAVARWAGAVHNQVRHEAASTVHHCLAQMVSSATQACWRAWGKWLAVLQAETYTRWVLRRCLVRMRKVGVQKVMQAMSTWAQFVTTASRDADTMRRCITRIHRAVQAGGLHHKTRAFSIW